MYSPIVIKSNLDAIQSSIDLRPKPEQFTLHEYTIEESQWYTNYLLDKVVKDGKSWSIAGLSQPDINFIENERILCQNNFRYYLTHYVWIESTLKSETAKVILFPINIAQEMLLKVVADLQEQHIAVILQILKARQLGSTTISVMIIGHRINFWPNTKALMGSSDPDKTSEMTDKLRFMWERLPPWLKPEGGIKPSSSAKEEIWLNIPELDNRIIRQHGTQLSGIGRGNTPICFHLSEIPDFNDPDEDIDASLLPAVHDNPLTFGVLESTAKGDVGYWPKTWRYNKKNWSLGKADMYPLFFPYLIGTDLYPTKTWKRKHPIPKDWNPKGDTLSHKDRAEFYIRHDPILNKLLGKDYVVPSHQLYWYEIKKEEAEDKGNLAKFLEEFPATPEEAFQHTGRSIFTLKQIEELRNRAKQLAMYKGKPAVFTIIGTDILSEHEPHVRDIDVDRPPIEIVSNILGDNKATYRLIPMKFYPSMLDIDSDDWDKILFIWEFPFTKRERDKVLSRRSDTEYGLGNDNAEGIGANKTAIEVVRKGTLYEPSEQVAEWASRWINANELVPWMDAIGAYYSKWDNDTTNEAKMVIEIAAGGSGLQHRLRVDRGWYNFHRWEGKMDSPKRKKLSVALLGWETNMRTRPWIVGEVARDLKDGYLKIHSPHLIRECQTLQKEDEEAKIEAKGDDTDDLYFAIGMVHHSLSVWDIRSRIDAKYSIAEPLSPTLNDSLSKVIEQQKKDLSKVDYYLYNDTLPTLD